MGRGWQKRKNAAESDVRRMYLRGRTGILKVEALPLEQALALAKIGQAPRPAKPRAAKATPLASDKRVVAVPASEATKPKPAVKRNKAPWAVGRLRSGGGVLRPKAQPKGSAKPIPIDSKPSPQDMVSKQSKGRKRKNRVQGTAKSTGKNRTILKYDGQPRFQGGFRIVQGGLPELGRR
jgi:hypothetical protein